MITIRVIAILTDRKGETIGARICNSQTGEILDMQTEKLKALKETEDITGLIVENALIDSNGFVRAKSENLNKKVVSNVIKNTRPNAIENREMLHVKKLLNQSKIILYHGNKNANMVHRYGIGDKNNDYGSGFYTTPNKELGKEWAMTSYTRGETGYVHTYELDKTGLNILNLTELDSLHWIAELLANRTINIERKEVTRDTIKEFLKRYKLNTSSYDIIVGYRADDKYFTYAEDFVSGVIYRETVENALRYGDLGIQVFIKSKRAFDALKIACPPEIVPEIYKAKYDKRQKDAEERYIIAKLNKQYAVKKEKIDIFIK